MLSTKYIIILIIIIIVILFLYNKQENITTDSGKTLSDEAIQTLASVYNTQNLTATNITATGKINGKLCSPNGNNCLIMQDDNNLVVYDKDNKPIFDSVSAQIASNRVNTKQIYFFSDCNQPNDKDRPIKDEKGRTYNTSDYLLIKISGKAWLKNTNNQWMIIRALTFGFNNNLDSSTQCISVLAIPKGLVDQDSFANALLQP